MISKQFLDTGIIWAVIGGLFSVIFRLQLGYPDQTFPFLEDILGQWAKGGKLDPGILLCTGYHARNHPGILCINSRIKRNIFKLFNSITDWCKRYGISIS